MFRWVLVTILSLILFNTGYSQEHYHKLDYYMYLFAKNIEWPDSLEEGEFIIGVLGNTDANEHLQFLAKHQKVRDMQVLVKVFEEPQDIEFCHLLFLPDALSENMAKLLKNLPLNTLLVTETPGMAVLGSGINISWTKKFESINYELNRAAFRKAGLKISEQLVSSSAF